MSAVRWIATIVALLGLCAPLALALSGLSGVGHRWIDILAQFTGPALIATVLGVAVLAVSRLWIATGVGGAVVMLLIFAVWPQWFPARGEPRPGAPTLSLYSANLYRGNADVEAIRRSVQAADADVVVLIETGVAPSSRLDEILAAYPHVLVRPSMRLSSPHRRVIASRYPLTGLDTRTAELEQIGAVVASPLGPVTVVAVHLTRPWPYQYQWGQIIQTMELEAIVADIRGPVIVAGDFNSISSARIGRQVQDMGLVPAPGWPGTWPSRAPSAVAITIDQVYRSPDLALVDRRLGRPNGSDHRPVITRFTLAQPPG